MVEFTGQTSRIAIRELHRKTVHTVLIEIKATSPLLHRLHTTALPPRSHIHCSGWKVALVAIAVTLRAARTSPELREPLSSWTA